MRKAAGIPESFTFHDSRHTHGSQLLAAGLDVATVSEVLGHANPGVTMRTYAHALPNRKREAAERVDALYGA